MRIRYYTDPVTGLPHMYRHGVSEEEVATVLEHPLQDMRGREDSRIAIGQTVAGRYLQVIYVPDPMPKSVFVITAYELGPKGKASNSTESKEKEMSKQKYPKGWNEKRVRRVISYYDSQTDADVAKLIDRDATLMEIPTTLVPKVRELIAKRVRQRSTKTINGGSRKSRAA